LQAAYRWSYKALAFGQHSAIVTWGVRATTLPQRRAHRGGGSERRFDPDN